MSGFFQAISNGLNAAATHVRDTHLLTPQELKNREEARKKLEMGKVATVIGCVVALLFFSIFPGLFTLCLLGLMAFTGREIYTGAQNCLEILDNALVEATARANKESFINQVTKNTLLGKSILRMIDPDLTPVLF